jgi:Tol biopolymer transport system component
MKPLSISTFITLLLPILVMSNNSYGHDKSSVLVGPYVGQNPPNSTPKAFAPSGLSSEYRDHSGFLTPDMKEFYFTRRNNKDGKWSLMVFKLENNRWRESVIGPRVGRPILNPNGKIMHLGKHYKERTESGWSEQKSLGPLFKDFRIMRLISSANGTYYFDEANESGPIRYSRLIDGKHEKPKAVKIDFGDWNAHPFIAPDESYLIWDEQGENGNGGADLFISFRQKDGTWGGAINLGDTINTSANEGGATVTPDGKYLFFNRYISNENAGMYWVDAQIIESLRPKS